MAEKQTKFIFVTGGVVSGLGKGITAASLGRLLKCRGLKVASQKLDPYVNVDPGTMSPLQHGEVFVTDDGTETDLDLGHYERFIDENLNKYSNLTTGKVYWNVLNKERQGAYLGQTVQIIPHITNEIKSYIYNLASSTEADVVITEIGGTTGDIESQPFLEAIRQVGLEQGRDNCCYIHVVLVPYISGSDEYKSKPAQHSVKELQGMGVNPDIIILREAAQLVVKKAVQVVRNLSAFADRWKDTPCLGYTHLQPAQLTTVGKRAALWINELLMDIDELEFRLSRLQLLGSKGTTGTQASFLELFGGDEGKIQEMERLIADEMGFAGVVPVSGQTYSRKVDSYFLSALSGIAQSAMKFANDLRIAQSFEELEEPFEKHQIGSSAMPYKRNPMRSERMCALARYVMTDSLNPAFTAGTQWFERTLDDSANKRLSVAEAFLATDAILNIYMNITEGIVVYERVIARRVMEKLPFMATENILMESVKRGGDRQELHEALRVHSHAAAARVKLEGGQNDLLDRIAADPLFPLSREELEEMLDPRAFIGCCPSQVTRFLKDTVQPVVDRWGAKETLTAKLEV